MDPTQQAQLASPQVQMMLQALAQQQGQGLSDPTAQQAASLGNQQLSSPQGMLPPGLFNSPYAPTTGF